MHRIRIKFNSKGESHLQIAQFQGCKAVDIFYRGERVKMNRRVMSEIRFCLAEMIPVKIEMVNTDRDTPLLAAKDAPK